MAYEAKAGSFSLFVNDRKEKASHPDWRGDGIDLDGVPIWVSAWEKTGARGKFFSCAMTPKDKNKKGGGDGGGGAPARARPPMREDDIPF